ncbi:MAG: 5-oxoprolinase subunit PxpB [Oceanospirillaceae bacterium]|nr:5-oxoprolinase subunit PxpB [Oceanospirillaceae bacterium]
MLEIRPASVDSLLILLGERADPATSARVAAATALIRRELAPILIDLVPSYASILLSFDLRRDSVAALSRRLESLLQDLNPDAAIQGAGRLVTLPVWYDPQVGPDLETLAQRHDMTVAKLIDLHVSPEYRVYAIGFSPGFGYLGDVDPRIATPRRDTPRTSVPAGSVALAERQTAVYPQATPGGWHVLGRCPLTLFDASAAPYLSIQVGDRVRFEPIAEAEYRRLLEVRA